MIHSFKTSDCPDADGRVPQPGEQKWTLSFPLEGDDDYLEVQIGAKGRESFLRMLEQEKKDDEAER